MMLLTCPRVSPEYELNAVQALMKPNEWTKGRIEHVGGGQLLPKGAREGIETIRQEVAEGLGFRPEIHWPAEGDYWFVIQFPTAQLEEAKGLARVISQRLPGIWLTIGRVLVRDGKFIRRKYGYQLKLVPATNVHIRRDIRAGLNGCDQG